MTWRSLQHRLDQLPLLLAGPILRRTEPDAVTVWMALKEPCRVTLRVYETDASAGLVNPQPVLDGTRLTAHLGAHLHVVAVTARPIDRLANHSVESDRLQPGKIYAYDLAFDSSDISLHAADSHYTLQQALQTADTPPVSISYFNHQLPTFALPPDDLNQLRIVHGSCRKPHGAGRDALAILDDLIAQHSASADERPHQVFFTGDQIYGDDVADLLLWMLTDVGDTLLGWQESLPLEPTPISQQTSVTPQQLKPGDRRYIAEHQAGLTAGLHHKRQRVNSHLLSLGEYCASYLFAWSPVLWPQEMPSQQEVYGDSFNKQKARKQWSKDVDLLRDFQQTLEKVRRSLANVPTYMIFDDHDISDDWYLNQAWCVRVLGKPLGRHTVQNGLLAYAIFQGWGNTPDQFESGKPGEQLLTAAQTWSVSAGQDRDSEVAIARYLGLPPVNFAPANSISDPSISDFSISDSSISDHSATDPPLLIPDDDVLILNRDAQALTWHYTVRSQYHEVIVLDTRTWRGYPMDQASTAPPRLLSPTAFDRQLRTAFQQTDRLNQTRPTQIETTFVVAPTNLFHMQILNWIQHWSLKQNNVFDNDVGDAWNINQTAFVELLAVLFERRKQVIVLSGDIHHGFAVHVQYWSRQNSNSSSSSQKVEKQTTSNSAKSLVQLTSSAFKNTEFKTQLIHTKLKSLFPEPDEIWIGWQSASSLHPSKDQLITQKRLPTSRGQAFWQSLLGWLRHGFGKTKTVANRPPDWRYHSHWIKRQPAKTVFQQQPIRVFKPASNASSSWLSRCKKQFSWLWRNRWLQDGTETIGQNNLSVVRLDHPSPKEQRAVLQDLYWYPLWKPSSIVSSRFYAPMSKDNLSLD